MYEKRWITPISSAKSGLGVLCVLFALQLFDGFGVVDGYSARESSNQDGLSEFSLRHSFYHNPRDTSPPIWLAYDVHESNTLLDQGNAARSSFKLRRQTSLGTSKGDAAVRSKGTNAQHILDNSPGASRPNISDRDTVINLAKMTSDAYINSPELSDWLNLTDGFNRSRSFGWKKDGLRGHIFANEDNSTVVVAFKGTTVEVWNSLHDRENDNVLFSCCCASQRKDYWPWRPVCDCRQSTYKCDSTCLSAECGREDRYFAKAKEVVMNATAWYPGAQVWLTGHSLGGALASLAGMAFHLPVVTFESPPERLPAQRLGLTMSGENYIPAYHFGNTADPVWMGACNGMTSLCSLAGYAFETQCFTGMRCEYDTVGDKHWHLNLLNHRINEVITKVLEVYPAVPNCTVNDDCEGVDCYNWSFSDG